MFAFRKRNNLMIKIHFKSNEHTKKNALIMEFTYGTITMISTK